MSMQMGKHFALNSYLKSHHFIRTKVFASLSSQSIPRTLEESKMALQERIGKDRGFQRTGDRTFAILDILESYKKLRRTFMGRGYRLELEPKIYAKLLDISYTPTGIPFDELIANFKTLGEDVEQSYTSWTELGHPPGKTILDSHVALSLLQCLDKPDAVVQSIEIVKKYQRLSEPILSALLFIRNQKLGSLNTFEWFKEVVKKPFYENERGQFHIRWSKKNYNSMMYFLLKDGKFREAESVLEMMNQNGITPSPSSYNFLVSFYGKRGLTKDMWRVFSMMERSNCMPTNITYEALIESLLAPNARNLFPKDKPRTIKPPIAPSDVVKEAHHYMSIMRSKDITPTAWSYNSFMTFYLIKKDYKRVEDLYHQMLQENIQPNIKSYTIMIQTYFVTENAMKASALIQQVREMGVKMDKVMYSICIDGYQKLKMYSKALSFYVEMLERGYKPSIQDYHILWLIYCSKGDVGNASRLWDEFTDAGFRPTEHTFAIFIKGFGKCADLERAKRSFDLMEEYKVPRSTIVYNALASAYIGQGRVTETLALIDEMMESDIKPDHRTSYILMNCYSQSGDEENLLKAFSRHAESGFQVDAYVINLLVKFYVKKDELEKAQKIAQFLFDSSKSKPELNPQPGYTHSILMQPLSRYDRAADLQKYMSILKEIRLYNSVTFDIYLRSLRKRAEFDLVQKEFWENIVTHIIPDHRLFATFISIMFQAGRFDECRRAYRLMTDNGMMPTIAIRKLMQKVNMSESGELQAHELEDINPQI